MTDVRTLHVNRLIEGLEEAKHFGHRGETAFSPVFRTWRERTQQSLNTLFGTDHDYSKRFRNLSFWLTRVGVGSAPVRWTERDQEKFDHDTERAQFILADAVDEVRFVASTPESDARPEPPSGETAFIVHGRDAEAKESVARYVERLGVRPIILHEQPSQGRTLIEKLEQYSAVAFAIVLLTPDDVGATATAPNELQPRARQNVLLELGYFVAKLGRERVCALHREHVEIPSDILGVVYIRMDDAGAWKLELGREMKAAGLTVDLNRAV